MNNKIEVIGIDHGWSNIKTATQVFVTGVKEITTEPALFDEVLEYKGKYYKIGGSRQEVRNTKTEDDTLFETDSPYLIPDGVAGKRNTSKSLNVIVEKFAELRGESPEHIREVVLKNTKRLYPAVFAG